MDGGLVPSLISAENGRRQQIPKSQVRNPKSHIPNPKSEINPEKREGLAKLTSP
jgi:hypothetical protein